MVSLLMLKVSMFLKSRDFLYISMLLKFPTALVKVTEDHSIARFILLNGGSFVCLEDGTPCLMDYINQDLSIISYSRDLGFMHPPLLCV